MPDETIPRVSRINAGIAGFALLAMVIGTIAPFVWLVVLPYATTGVALADWSALTITVALLGMVALYAYLGTSVYQRFATIISAEGLSVPALRGRRTVAWSEVQGVGVRGHEVLLETPSGRIVLNLHCFSNPTAAAGYLQSKLSAPEPGKGGAV